VKFNELEQLEVRFSGSGGQGLVLASIIFADILVDRGYNVIQGESHGIEARGGASRGEVIGSKSEITDLSVSKPDIFVSLSQESLNKYYKDVKQESLVLIDSFLVKEIPEIDSSNVFLLPFTKRTKEKLNSVIPANIAFLGVIAELTQINDRESYGRAIKYRVPEGTKEMNLEAFKLGVEMAEELKASEE